MDKTPFENEDTSSVEPNELETDHTIAVKTKQIDVLSLPQKNILPRSDKNKICSSSNEQPLDEQWLALSQDWQSQPYEKTNIQALLKQTKRRTLQAKSMLVIDVIATVFLIIMLIVGLYQGDWGTATITYLIFGVITSIVLVYYEIKIRLRIWQRSCDSPDKAVANAIAGVESSLKYIQLLKLSCWLLIPAANVYIYAEIEESGKSPWLPFFVMNVLILTLWLISHWFQKKRTEELLQLSGV